MKVKYQCCICDALYDWYDGVYENEAYSESDARKARCEGKPYEVKSGVYINANAIRFMNFAPAPDRCGETLEEGGEDIGNLEDFPINLCPDCMRKLLKKIKPDSHEGNCFSFV